MHAEGLGAVYNNITLSVNRQIVGCTKLCSWVNHCVSVNSTYFAHSVKVRQKCGWYGIQDSHSAVL